MTQTCLQYHPISDFVRESISDIHILSGNTPEGQELITLPRYYLNFYLNIYGVTTSVNLPNERLQAASNNRYNYYDLSPYEALGIDIDNPLVTTTNGNQIDLSYYGQYGQCDFWCLNNNQMADYNSSIKNIELVAYNEWLGSYMNLTSTFQNEWIYMVIDANSDKVYFCEVSIINPDTGAFQITLPCCGVGFMLHKEFED